MATTTPQLSLRKPAGTDLINVTTDISENMDKIDGASNKILGYATVITNQTGITSVDVDITSLTVTFTVGTSRRLRVTGVTNLKSSVDGDIGAIRLTDSANTLLKQTQMRLTGSTQDMIVSMIFTLAAGTYTYKIRATRTLGSGSLETNHVAANPGWLMIEDIGAA